MSPSFVIFIVYPNLTIVESTFFLWISTFGIMSVLSSPVFPVSVVVVTPSSVTYTVDTYFNKLKSNVFIKITS